MPSFKKSLIVKQFQGNYHKVFFRGKEDDSKGPAKRIQHHPTLLNPTLLDDVAQC